MSKKKTNAELQKEMESNKQATDDRLEAIETSIEEVSDVVNEVKSSLGEFNELMRGMTAKDRPTEFNKDAFEASEQNLGGGHVMEMEAQGRMTGDDVDFIERPTLQDIDTPMFKDKMEIEKFMQDKLSLHVAPNQLEPSFVIRVNGFEMTFISGKKFTGVPRFIVEQMARCKPIHYRNEEYKLADGTDAVRWPGTTELRYNFTVLHDPRGDIGRAWLQRILAED